MYTPPPENNFLSKVRFELTDVPPTSPPNEKVGFQVIVTFWFGNKHRPKSPPKSSKNEMFIFGLHSISDDRPSDPSDKH